MGTDEMKGLRLEQAVALANLYRDEMATTMEHRNAWHVAAVDAMNCVGRIAKERDRLAEELAAEKAKVTSPVQEAKGPNDRIVGACRSLMGLRVDQPLVEAVAGMMEENRKLRRVKATGSRLPNGPLVINGRKRRNDLGLRTEAENAITAAGHAVEAAGCHEWLTEAIDKLQEARELVADFVERDQ